MKITLKEAGVRSIVILTTSIICIAIGELIFAYAYPPQQEQYRDDPILNHTYKPNNEFEYFVEENNSRIQATYSTNELGFVEGRATPATSAPGNYRILYLGDSFIAGLGNELSIPTLVEKQLNELHSSFDTRIEVVNAGTPSYSPTLEYLLLTTTLKDHEFDLIVLNIDMTDDFDEWRYRETLITDEAGIPIADPPRDSIKSAYVEERGVVRKQSLVRKTKAWLLKHSNIYSAIVRYRGDLNPTPSQLWQELFDVTYSDEVKKFHASGIYTRWSWNRYTYDELTESNVTKTIAMIQRIIDHTKERGVPLVIAPIPHYPLFVQDGGSTFWSQEPIERLRKLSEENDITFIDTIDLLKETIAGTEQTTYYLHNDMHFNRAGYQLLAGAHVNALSDLDLLPFEFSTPE